MHVLHVRSGKVDIFAIGTTAREAAELSGRAYHGRSSGCQPVLIIIFRLEMVLVVLRLCPVNIHIL